MADGRITAEAAAARLPEQRAEQPRFATLLKRGSMSVEVYAPQGHGQDEPCVVARRGEFVNGGARQPFGPGDVMFAPAGVAHRFENFSADFQTRVMFYGPPGGEQPAE